jgi:hypothetical protein
MKKEKKDQIIRRISEQSMLKLTPMAFSTLGNIEFMVDPEFYSGLLRKLPSAILVFYCKSICYFFNSFKLRKSAVGASGISPKCNLGSIE